MNLLDFDSWFDKSNLDFSSNHLEDDRSSAAPRNSPEDGYNLEWQMRRNERLVLMEHRQGMRLEWNLSRRECEIWISPQAGRSTDPFFRNFSSRDDHTSLFDQIRFPCFADQDFVKCCWDPFHSVIHYRTQQVHILCLYDSPAIVLWSDGDWLMDFKTDKGDSVQDASPNRFSILHPDRGLDLEFAAVLGQGAGTFHHQRNGQSGRSRYARAAIAAGQILVLAGELKAESPANLAVKVAELSSETLINRNELYIAAALETGKVAIPEKPAWQKQFDLNKRVLLANQDASGAIRAASPRIYYLIWRTDGSVINTYNGLSGRVDLLENWNRFQLACATRTDDEPQGSFFGQLVDPRLGKREHYGLFLSLWAAFTHFTQTGSRMFGQGVYRDNILAATDWMERAFFDSSRGAFGVEYVGENPFIGSHDFGWDEAVGRKMTTAAPARDGELIVRSYDMDINLQMWNTYLMLAAMEDRPEAAETWLAKAKTLEPFLENLLGLRGEPISPGLELLRDGRMVRCPQVRAPWMAWFQPFFHPRPEMMPKAQLDKARELLPRLHAGEPTFVMCLFWLMVGADPLWVPEREFESLLDASVELSGNSGKYLQMPGAMPECVNVDEDAHDVRPQNFTIGAFQAALVTRVLYRMPFGLALRGSRWIRRVANYPWRDTRIDVQIEGQGKTIEVTINGQPLEGSLQIPQSRLQKKVSRIEVRLSDCARTKPLWESSSVELSEVSSIGDGWHYSLRSCGPAHIAFSGIIRNVDLRDARGRDIPVSRRVAGDRTFLVFDHPGAGTLIVT